MSYHPPNRFSWLIVHSERLSEPFASSSTCKNPFNPAFNVVQRIVGNSKDLTELSLVRDWLSSITSTSNLIETRNGYYPFTKNSLKQQRRLGKEPATIKSLDPDATFRQGKPLLVEDAVSISIDLIEIKLNY